MSGIEYEQIRPATQLIHLDSGEFKLTLKDIKARHRNFIWGSVVTEDIVGSLGYAVVHKTPPPTGDIVTETNPVLIDGLHYQQWVVSSKNAEQLNADLEAQKKLRISEINRLVTETLAYGAPYNFGTDQEPIIRHIQIRDGDRANHVGMSTKAQRDPDVQQFFRTYENDQFLLNAEEVVRMTDTAYDGYLGILKASWELKDAVENSLTVDSLPDIPTTLQQFYVLNLQWPWPA